MHYDINILKGMLIILIATYLYYKLIRQIKKLWRD